MIHHFSDQPFFLSGFGATLFLVLSGYFATKTLIRLRNEMDSGRTEASLALKSFYIQRCLRLFPLYYLVLLLALIFRVEYARSTFLWNAAFLSNFRILLTGEWNGRFSPLWSLSLLEQFYLAWPALILFCPKRRLLPITILTILIAPAYRLVCLGMDFGPIYWSVAPLSSLDQLGSGALLAICGSDLVAGPIRERIMGFAGKICFPVFTALLICKAWHFNPPGCAVYINFVASLAFIWLVKKAETGFEGKMRILMENPALGYIGRISYSIFLLHTFSELLVPRIGILQPLMHSNFRAIILIPVTILLAHFSYWLIETPIQSFRKRYERSARGNADAFPIPASLAAG